MAVSLPRLQFRSAAHNEGVGLAALASLFLQIGASSFGGAIIPLE